MDTSTDWACLICCEVSGFKVLGKCNHPICLTCVVKQRDLCEQKYCPVCREDLDKVIGVFQFSHGSYEELEKSCKISGPKPGYKFEDRKVLNAFRELFAMRCRVCKRDCKTIQSLEDHLKREHNKYFCQICKDNLKVFTKDLNVYSKDALRTHRVKGEESDSSMKGHPLCEFCQERYLDNEVLHLHLRKKHFWCHLCDGQAFYCAYADLRLHFQQNHYLCERGECAQEQLTNVFRSAIDLQAHVTSRHVNELGKAQQKQMRQIQPNFTTSRSNNRNRGAYSRGPPNERPSSSRANDIDITDLGSWDVTVTPRGGSTNRPLKAKPSLGNKPRMRQPPPDRQPQPDRQPPSNRTSAPNRPESVTESSSRDTDHSVDDPQRQRKLAPSNRKEERSKSPKVSYRRDESGNQKRPSERSKEAEREEKSSSTLPDNASSVSSSSEVGRPPPEEPDVGHPPGDVYTPLGDDEDFRKKRGGKKKKTASNPDFPALGRDIRPKKPSENSAWGKGAPGLAQQSQPKQGKKQKKTQHSDNFDDESDFLWMESDPRTKQKHNKDKQKSKKEQTETKPQQPIVKPEVAKQTTKPKSAETGQRKAGLMDELSEIAEQLSSTNIEQTKAPAPSSVPTPSVKEFSGSSGTEDFPVLASSASKANKAHWVDKSRPSQPHQLDNETNYPPLPPPKHTTKPALTGSKRSAGRGSRSWARNNPDIRDVNNYPPLGSDKSQPLTNGHGKHSHLSVASVHSDPGSRSASPPLTAQQNPVIQEPASRLTRTPPPDLRTILNLPPNPAAPPPASTSVKPPPDFSSILGQTNQTLPAESNQSLLPSSSAAPPDLTSIIMGSAVSERSYDVPPDVPEISSGLIPSVPQQRSGNDKNSPGGPESKGSEDQEPSSLTAMISVAADSEIRPPDTDRALRIETLPQSEPTIETHLRKLAESEISVSSIAVSESGPISVTPNYINTRGEPVHQKPAPNMGPPGMPPGIPQRHQANLAEANGEVKVPPGMTAVQQNGVSYVQAGPPGLTQPPGFGGPPGLGVTEQQSRGVFEKSNVTNNIKIEAKYHIPQNGNARNLKLLNSLQMKLGPIVFSQFHTSLKAFSAREMSAQSFFRISRMIIVSQDYDAILEELIALLPDIERQHELYSCLGQPINLIPCTVCGQIVKKEDLVHHSEHHQVSVQSSGHRTKFQNVI